MKNTHFKIIMTCRNAVDWITKSIESVLSQTYENWELIITDAGSVDGTWEKIKNAVGQSNKCIFHQNCVRKFALQNFVESIQNTSPNAEDVILILDGDDWFSHNKVLSFLDNQYKADPKLWITWGSYKGYPKGNIGRTARAIPEKWNIRTGSWIFSHLQSFKYFLWQNIKNEDFKTSWDNTYYPMGQDNAFMRPMIEMAGPNHRKFLKEILYIYNEINPLSDRQIDEKLQRRCSSDIRKKSPYSQINKPQ